MKLFAETLTLTSIDRGSGRTMLLLHGGAGMRSMAGFAERMAGSCRTILPTHPGFDGQPRPDWFCRIGDLALAYLSLIERLGLDDVVVVGNSAGGWIAAEMAVRASPRIARLVLIDAVGLDPTEATGPIADPSAMEPAEMARRAFHDPPLMKPGPEQAKVAAANLATLDVYGGDPFMYDPALRGRLPGVAVPTLVLWGESDGIASPDYGRQFADLIPGAVFELVPEAGHLPQVEQPDRVADAIGRFFDR